MKIILHVTNNCNLRCEYCYLKKLNVYGNNYLSIENASKFIDIISKKVKDVNIYFLGTEPLMNFDLIKKITKKYGRKYDYSLTTNGTLIDDNILDAFKKYSIKSVISYDGIYQDINRNNTSKKVLKNIKKIKSELKEVRTNTVVTKKQCKNLFKIYLSLIETGANKIKINLDQHEIWDEKSINLVYREYKKIIDHYLSKKIYKKTDIPFNLGNENCYESMKKTISLLPNGNISICNCVKNNRYYPNFVIGNIEDKDIAKKIGRLIEEDNIIPERLLKSKFIKIFKKNKLDVCFLLNYEKLGYDFNEFYESKMRVIKLKEKISEYHRLSLERECYG